MGNLNIEWWWIINRLVIFLYFWFYFYVTKQCLKMQLSQNKELILKSHRKNWLVLIYSLFNFILGAILATVIITAILTLLFFGEDESSNVVGLFLNFNLLIASLFISVPYSIFRIIKYIYWDIKKEKEVIT